MEIQTEQQEGWVTIKQFNCWEDVIKAGWKFKGLDNNNNVVMVRNGYINLFRQLTHNKAVVQNDETKT